MNAGEYARLYGLDYVGRKRLPRRRVYEFTDVLTANTLLVRKLSQLPTAVLRSRAPGFEADLRKRARAQAVELSEKFYDMPPRFKGKIDLEWPTALVSLGPCAQVDYISDKWDGIVRRYFHEFEDSAVLYADAEPQPDGTRILVIHGSFDIMPDGIAG